MLSRKIVFQKGKYWMWSLCSLMQYKDIISFLSQDYQMFWGFFVLFFFNLARSTIYLEVQTPPIEEIEIY